MKCKLCEREIENYNPEFNNLKISDTISADICQECVDKFMDWQHVVLAKLFPSKMMKKRFGKK